MPDLSSDPQLDAFDIATLRAELKTLQADSAVSGIHVLENTPSSNDEAAQLARAGAPNRSLVIAQSQSAGRGRRGNVWNSPPGRDLLFSLLLYPDPDTQGIELQNLRLPHLVAVAICHAIESVLPDIVSQIKWPNDIYAQGKKYAGILIESASISSKPYFIVGIGINVNSLNSERPAELHTTATSLREECQHLIDRHQVMAAFLHHFDQLYPRGLVDFSSISKELTRRSLLIGHEISASLNGEKITGKAIGFADYGELILESTQAHGKEQRIIHSADLVRLL